MRRSCRSGRSSRPIGRTACSRIGDCTGTLNQQGAGFGAPAAWTAAVLCRFLTGQQTRKAAEDWRTPSPVGGFEKSWQDLLVLLRLFGLPGFGGGRLRFAFVFGFRFRFHPGVGPTAALFGSRACSL